MVSPFGDFVGLISVSPKAAFEPDLAPLDIPTNPHLGVRNKNRLTTGGIYANSLQDFR